MTKLEISSHALLSLPAVPASVVGTISLISAESPSSSVSVSLSLSDSGYSPLGVSGTSDPGELAPAGLEFVLLTTSALLTGVVVLEPVMI